MGKLYVDSDCSIYKNHGLSHVGSDCGDFNRKAK